MKDRICYSTDEIIRAINADHFRIDGDFRNKDILSVEQFGLADIQRVLQRTAEFREMRETGRDSELREILKGKNVFVGFYQQSTRTYTSFISAAQRLGAQVVGIPGMMEYSSAYKGETLEDTVKTVESLEFDAIVLRHPDDDSALRAAHAVKIPIFNGGSGKLEHPSQALLDLYTVIDETGKNPAELNITFVGDLKNGRTVHSLAKLMEIIGNRSMNFVAPDVTPMPRNIIQSLRRRGVEIQETNSLEDVIGTSDVLYITRVQKEWFTNDDDYQRACSATSVTPDLLRHAKKTAVVMHPLPRVNEIATSVDSDPRAAYFREVKNGLYTRMALLSLVLTNNS